MAVIKEIKIDKLFLKLFIELLKRKRVGFRERAEVSLPAVSK